MFGYIYKTTNLVNGKIYIGQHMAEAFDKYYKGSGQLLQRAFKKYGKENFACEMLETAETKEELDGLEQFWITKLNSRDLMIGYNIVAGGGGTVGYKHTDRAKKAMSEAKKALPPMSDLWRAAIGAASKGRIKSDVTRAKLRAARLGKKHTEETKQKLRDAHKRNPRNFDDDYRRKLRESRAKAIASGKWSISEEGMKHLRESGSKPKTLEHRERISNTRKIKGVAAGAKNPRAKKIYCIETNTVYSWAGEAAEALGLSVHMIRQCRQGKLEHVHGYHFIDFIE